MIDGCRRSLGGLISRLKNIRSSVLRCAGIWFHFGRVHLEMVEAPLGLAIVACLN